MKMVRHLNNKQCRLLKACGRFKFLSFDQVQRLGIEKDKGNISRLFKSLRESRKPLVRKIPHNNGEPAVHYLTPTGRKVLIDLFPDEETENIHFVPTILYSNTQDHRHRMTTINIQIEIELCCIENEICLGKVERYFDTVGENRVSKSLKSKTAFLYDNLHSVKADLIFFLQTQKQLEMYVTELEMGKDTKKAVTKCVRMAKAILLKSANIKYGFERGYRTLWIFEHESIMFSTMNRLKENPFFTHLSEYFLFKPLPAIGYRFFEGWLNLTGKERKIYYL